MTNRLLIDDCTRIGRDDEHNDEHEWNDHDWCDIEYGYLSGQPYRKCSRCRFVSLDLDDEGNEE